MVKFSLDKYNNIKVVQKRIKYINYLLNKVGDKTDYAN